MGQEFVFEICLLKLQICHLQESLNDYFTRHSIYGKMNITCDYAAAFEGLKIKKIKT